MVRRKKSSVPKNTPVTLKKVGFSLSAPEAQNVLLVGDFNGWEAQPYPLKKDKKGNWKLQIELTPGHYEYRFLVDGEWRNDPKCTSFVPNPYGSENCVLTLESD